MRTDAEPGTAEGGVLPIDRLLPPPCYRPGTDPVKQVFCGAEPPPIDGFDSLLSALRTPASALGGGGYGGAAYGGDEGLVGGAFVMLGLSTALSGRVVSPINPRVILLGEGVAVAFQRGVQQVEIAAVAAKGGGLLNFYLVTFRQACNQRPSGCLPGDLYTPRVETDWLEVGLQDAEDLENTPSDCRQCHQRGLERPMLLMRELEGPWTHFFLPPQAEEDDGYPGLVGGDLAADFLKAHGDEPYAGVTNEALQGTAGLILELAMALPQPVLFDSSQILNERWRYGPDGYPSIPYRSETWDRHYAAFQRGEELPLPHFDERPTDPDKQSALTEAYQRYRAGDLPAEQLPDLADVFPDDPAVRAELGLQTLPGATPAEALVQACGNCHNDVLDQSISRARFNIDLSRMSRAELELAIERVELERDAPGAMPPPDFRQLDDEARTALVDYLRRQEFPETDRALLERAARLGMAGYGESDP